MDAATCEWEKMSPKEKADTLKGGMSYKEHYSYLMDWYLRDRKQPDRIRGRISLVPEADVHESLKDVLEALKYLNAKIEGSDAHEQKPSRNLFMRLAGKDSA